MADMMRDPLNPGAGLLIDVVEGMAVYDQANEQVGTVKTVFFGGVEPADTRSADQGGDLSGEQSENPLVESTSVFGALTGDSALPETFRARLEREGYIAINSTGFFTRDRYASSSQIAQVDGDRVVLNVAKDELFKD